MKETFSKFEQTIITRPIFFVCVCVCKKNPLKFKINTQKKKHENHLCKLPELVQKYALINVSN